MISAGIPTTSGPGSPTGWQPVAPGPPVANALITYKSLEMLDREEKERMERAMKPVLGDLAGHVEACWAAAKNHRETSGLQAELSRCQRQRAGEYDQDKLAMIKEIGGSDLYFNITDTKCSAAEAWLLDVLLPHGEWSAELEATPIPDLPEDLKRQVVEQVVRHFQGAMAEPEPQEVMDTAGSFYDAALADVKAEAEKRARRMWEKMKDQLTEGGWHQACREVYQYLVTYPYAVLCGPEIEHRKRSKWVGGRLRIEREAVPVFKSINPHDFYWGPNNKGLDDGYVIERVSYDLRDLAAMKGLPGWNDDEIDGVLEEKPAPTIGLTVAGDTERRWIEGRDTMISRSFGESKVEGVKWWGAVEGQMLLDWGMKPSAPQDMKIPWAMDDDAELESGKIDAKQYYEICAVSVGGRVVRAQLNPSALGERPYSLTSYEKLPGSISGVSIGRKMRDCQNAANAALRNMVDNLAWASGPMTVVCVDLMAGGQNFQKQYPRKVWQADSTKMRFSGQKPIDFFQPTDNSEKLIRVAEYFEEKADDRTLIPRYVQGNANIRGAGQTASGMSMLMDSAAKGIKMVIGNIDSEMQRPTLDRLYNWNLCYLSDEEWSEAKGDCRVSAKGALAVLLRDQTQMRRQEFMTLIDRSPMAQAIVGARGFGEVLRAVAEGLDLPVDKIVPSDDELEKREEQRQAQEQAMQSAAMDQQAAKLGMIPGGQAGQPISAPPAMQAGLPTQNSMEQEAVA